MAWRSEEKESNSPKEKESLHPLQIPLISRKEERKGRIEKKENGEEKTRTTIEERS